MIDQRKKEVRKEVFSLYKAIRHFVLMRVSKKKCSTKYIYISLQSVFNFKSLPHVEPHISGVSSRFNYVFIIIFF